MIYVTGDIHGEIDISKLNTQNFSQAKAGDYLIVCGDFGLIWDMKPSRAEEYWMKWLSEKPWITLFVDENHVNNHKAYIQSWISELKNDPKVLFDAIKDADEIVDYIKDIEDFEKYISLSEIEQETLDTIEEDKDELEMEM